jgi:transposase
MTPQRRHFSPEQKVALLRQHLVEKVPLSEVCEKNGIAVNLFYLWQKTFFDNGTAAFTAHDLHGRDKEIWAARDRKLEAARERRKQKRHAARQAAVDGQPATCTT